MSDVCSEDGVEHRKGFLGGGSLWDHVYSRYKIYDQEMNKQVYFCLFRLTSRQLQCSQSDGALLLAKGVIARVDGMGVAETQTQ